MSALNRKNLEKRAAVVALCSEALDDSARASNSSSDPVGAQQAAAAAAIPSSPEDIDSESDEEDAERITKTIRDPWLVRVLIL